MLAALPSWRAEINSTPAPTSACEILKLAVPSRPKHRRAPNAARSLAMAAATVVLRFMAPSIEAPDARAGDVPALCGRGGVGVGCGGWGAGGEGGVLGWVRPARGLRCACSRGRLVLAIV